MPDKMFPERTALEKAIEKGKRAMEPAKQIKPRRGVILTAQVQHLFQVLHSILPNYIG